MRKYHWLFIVILISCAVFFSSCDRTQGLLSDISDPKPPEVTEPPTDPEPEVTEPDPEVVQPPTDPEPEVTEPDPEVVQPPTETPTEPTDPTGGIIDIEDAMSTIGLRKIYWIPDYDSFLARANPDGSDIEIIFHDHGLHPVDTTNLVVDSEGGKIYWNNSYINGGLWRANLDGTNIERLVTNPVANFTLDLENGKIYWIAQVDRDNLDTANLFHRSNLDGSGVEKFKTSAVQGLLGNLAGIAFDSMNRKIYASNPDTDRMFVINADDLDIKFGDLEFEFRIHNAGQTFALDIEDSNIYWEGGSAQRVYRVNFDGTNFEEVLFVDGMAATFDFNTRKMYWVEQFDRRIFWQADLDGSNPEALFAVGYRIVRIAVETGPIN